MRFTEKNKQNLSQKFALNRLIAAVSVAVIGVSGVAHAATAPDAGQVLQEIERDLEVKPLPEAPVVEAAPLEEDQGEKIVIKQFKFAGNKVLTEVQLQEALASLTSHEITVNQLKTCVDLIAAYYRQKGYLAVASLPEQDITDGVVTINIVEAIFGGVKFDGEYGKDFKRVKPSAIERVLGLDAYKGRPLNQNQLDKGLAAADALAGAKVQGNLQAGEASGSTDLLVRVADQPLLTSYVSLDNTGGRQTGREKLTAFLTLASPLGYGESITLTGLKSEGTEYGRISGMMPVNSSGLQLGVNASYLEYDVVTLEYRSQKLSGRSSNFGLQAQYPLFQNKTTKLKLGAEAEEKYFTNGGATGKSSDYKLRTYSLSLNADHADNFLAGAQNTAGLNLAFGDVDMDHSVDIHREGDKNGAHTQGSYARLRWNLSRNQFLTDSISLMLSGSGQFANANLDSSEKFYLGGVSGVRAYPTSEGAGSEGYLYSAELRKYLPNNLSVAAFVDHGYVKQYEDNTPRVPTTQSPVNSDINTYSLKGYGFSMNWQGPYSTNFKATYAHRMGSNPNPTATGNDQDGSKKYDVFWLSGSVAF